MVTYLPSYLPNISHFISDHRCLFKKDAWFQWRESKDVALQKIRYQIREDVCLRYFDTTVNVLQVAASQVQLDAVLLQDN